MPGGIGITELLVVLAVVLVIFGPKRLPGLGKSLGSGMKEFKDSISGRHGDDDDEEKPRLTATEADDEPAAPGARAADAQPSSSGVVSGAAEPRA